MNEHLHIHKKTGFQTASQPQQSQFQSRPFVVQPQTEEQSEQPDIKTALERAERYGHRLDRIKFSEARVQRPVPRIVQAKLTIGEPGDRYEQEADRVAASVVQQINAPAPQQSTQSQSVQREATPDEEDELMKKPDISAIQRKEESEAEIQAKPEITALQRQEEQEKEIQAKPNVSDLGRSPLPTQVQREAMPEEEELQTKSILQRREAIGGGEASTDVESAINSARGGGQPLDEGLQRSMGQAMGADFSGVKVHTDSQADKLNQSIQAKAFTTGQDVFFRQGEYNPGSRGGQELIAHELTHVVQQNGGAVQRSQIEEKKGAVVSTLAGLPIQRMKQDAGNQEAVNKLKERYLAATENNYKQWDNMLKAAKDLDHLKVMVDKVAPPDEQQAPLFDPNDYSTWSMLEVTGAGASKSGEFVLDEHDQNWWELLQRGQLVTNGIGQPQLDVNYHAHMVSNGKGGIAFYYRRNGETNEVEPVVYDYALKRNGNDYRWKISKKISNTAPPR